MKRLMLIALLLCLCLLLFACYSQSGSYERPVHFYYCKTEIDYQSNEGVIDKEAREGAAYADNLQAMIDAYLLGPESEDYYSPFPEGSKIKVIKREGNVLTVKLDDQYDTLPEEEMSLAMACLSQTIFHSTSASVIVVSANSAFMDGSYYKTFTAESFLFSDKNADYTPPQ